MDRIIVPVGNLVAVAPHVPPDAVAFIEPMSVAVQAIRRGQVASGEDVVVFGAGPVGQAARLAAHAAGAKIVESCGGAASEVVIDTTGTSTGFDRALAAVADGGRLVTVGSSGRRSVNAAGVLTRRSIDLVTLSCSTRADFVQAARIVASSVPGILPLISHKVRLDEVEKVLPRIGTAETMKVVVDMSAG